MGLRVGFMTLLSSDWGDRVLFLSSVISGDLGVCYQLDKEIFFYQGVWTVW